MLMQERKDRLGILPRSDIPLRLQDVRSILPLRLKVGGLRSEEMYLPPLHQGYNRILLNPSPYLHTYSRAPAFAFRPIGSDEHLTMQRRCQLSCEFRTGRLSVLPQN